MHAICISWMIAVTCALPPAHAQMWRDLPLPRESRAIMLAGDPIISGSLALWTMDETIRDTVQHALYAPWHFFVSPDAGGTWTLIDSGMFVTVQSGNSVTWNSWYRIWLANGRCFRSIVSNSPDVSSWRLQRGNPDGTFTFLDYPGIVSITGSGDGAGGPVIWPADRGIYTIRWTRKAAEDSTMLAVYRCDTDDLRWRIVPDSASGFHRLPPPTVFAVPVRDTLSMLLGTSRGLYLSGDAGRTWRPAHTATILDTARIEGAAAHPVRFLPVFAACRESGAVGSDMSVFRSVDYGATWQRVLSAPSVSDITMHADLSSHVLINCADHLAASSDGGATWRDVTGDLMQQAQQNIQWIALDAVGAHARAFAATSRRLFVCDNMFPATSARQSPIPERLSLGIAPNPAPRNGASIVSISGQDAGPAVIRISDVLGRICAELTLIEARSAGHLSLSTIAPALIPGRYFVSIVQGTTHAFVPLIVSD